jgi:hypothetical protein
MCICQANDFRNISFGQRDRCAYDETIVGLVHVVNSDVRAIKARTEFVGAGFFGEFGVVIILQTDRVPFEEGVGAPGHEAYLDGRANGLANACQFLSSSTGQLRD